MEQEGVASALWEKLPRPVPPSSGASSCHGVALDKCRVLAGGGGYRGLRPEAGLCAACSPNSPPTHDCQGLCTQGMEQGDPR